jgi:hypothetical protein
VDNIAHEDGWDSDIEESSIDLWEPLERALNTGIQLDELQAQKRMDDIISDIEKMKADYQAKHSEFFTVTRCLWFLVVLKNSVITDNFVCSRRWRRMKATLRLCLPILS